MDEHQIAQRLGWLSLGIGIAEFTMPGQVADMLGIRDGKRLIRFFGLREITAGLGILSQRKRSPWLWARVGGDVLDLGALAVAMRSSRKRTMVGLAIAGVATITALDVICGGQLAREGS
jgi:hypothetical protein